MRVIFYLLFFVIISTNFFTKTSFAVTGGNPVTRALAIGTTYGVLGGTFLGVASLAFVDHPRENLKNVAVGASIGLYAGILFGGYLAWSASSADRYEDLPTEENYDQLDYESKIEFKNYLLSFAPLRKMPELSTVMPIMKFRF